MIIFNSDLDNTLIYSYKREIGQDKICVETLDGREQAYMTKNSYELLHKVRKGLCFVPTTTRTMEQYKRIRLSEEDAQYALVCNGGVLLEDGVPDKEWYQKSLELIADCTKELDKGFVMLDKDPNRCFELHKIEDLFLYTKSSEPELSVQGLKEQLDETLVDIFYHRNKVYVVPKKLNKGMAAMRLREKLGGTMLIAAGDSEFDIPLLQAADLSFVPRSLEEMKKGDVSKSIIVENDAVFSDKLLKYIWETILKREKK